MASDPADGRRLLPAVVADPLSLSSWVERCHTGRLDPIPGTLFDVTSGKRGGQWGIFIKVDLLKLQPPFKFSVAPIENI